MLPNRIKPKYQILSRIQPDVGIFLYNKQFNKKKWKLFKEINKILLPKVLTYHKKCLINQPTYIRFVFKNNIIERLQIRYFYSQPQHYKIKLLVKKNKISNWREYIRFLEETSLTFLYRLKLVNSYREVLFYYKNKHIYVSGNPNKICLKSEDCLHFSDIVKKLFKRRLLINYIRSNDQLLDPLPIELKKKLEKEEEDQEIKKKKTIMSYYFGLNTCIDFDPNNFNFLFLSEIEYFKNHPFQIPFESIYQWYYIRI